MTTSKTPQELAKEGRYIEAGAIAEGAMPVTGFQLSLDTTSSGTYRFSGKFITEEGEVLQFEKVPVDNFESALIDFTQGATMKFLGYIVPERLQEDDDIEDTDT